MTEAGYRNGILAVALGAVLLALPFLGAPPLFDPDEGFYPATAWESLSHGHPLDLTLNGEPRWNKPPLAYALMQGSMLLLGKSEFAVRLPSVLEMGLLVALLGLVTARAAGGRSGLLAAAVAASCLGVQFYGRAAHPEMGLVLGTAVGEVLLAWWFVSPEGARPRWIPWAAGLALGFGFLAKGPAALALPALMLLASMAVIPRGNRPRRGAVAGAFGLAAGVALALAAPWYLWMGARHGEAFWTTVFGQLAHYTSGEHEHFGNHPLYFVPVLIGGFLPWAALLPWALRRLRRTDPSPRERYRLLMALAGGTAFLFWSLSTSKLPNYGLAFFPPLAVVVGMWLEDLGEEGWALAKGLIPAVSSWTLLGLGLLLLPVIAPEGIRLAVRSLRPPEDMDETLFEVLQSAAYAIGICMVLMPTFMGLLPGMAIGNRTRWSALPRGSGRSAPGGGRGLLAGLAASVGVVMMCLIILAQVPALAGLPFPHMAEPILEDEAEDAPVAVYRKRLPSLTFYLEREIPWPHTEEELKAFLEGPAPRWLVIHERHAHLVEEFAPGRTAHYYYGGGWYLIRKEP